MEAREKRKETKEDGDSVNDGEAKATNDDRANKQRRRRFFVLSAIAFLVSVLVLNSCLRPFFAPPFLFFPPSPMIKKSDACTLTRKRNRRQNTATIRRTRSGTRGQKACRQHRDRAGVLLLLPLTMAKFPVDDDRAT